MPQGVPLRDYGLQMDETKKQIKRWATIALGIFLLVLTPVVGIIPGPGGVVVFVLAVSVLSKEIPWVRRWFRTARTWIEKKWRTFRNTHKVRRVPRYIPLPPIHHPPAQQSSDDTQSPS